MEYVVPLEEKQQGVAHRAARYYRFDKRYTIKSDGSRIVNSSYHFHFNIDKMYLLGYDIGSSSVKRV